MPVLSFPYKVVPGPAQRIEVAKDVYWLRFSLPFALDHINLWLLRDGAGWALVDTGYGGERTRDDWIETFAKALDGLPIRRIIVTHYHPDHLGQAAWLAQWWQAPVSMTAGEWGLAQRLVATSDASIRATGAAFLRAQGLPAERAESVVANGNNYRRAVPELPATIEVLRDGDRFAINGRTWEVVCGSGHSPEHACLFRRDDNLLLSGDQILPTISSNVSVRREEPEADPLASFLASLSRLGELPADTLVLPAHGLPFRGLHERSLALSRHHQRQLARVEAACREAPQSAAEMLPVLFRSNLTDHEMHFAMGESLAHLNYLHRRGRLRRIDGEVVRFLA